MLSLRRIEEATNPRGIHMMWARAGHDPVNKVPLQIYPPTSQQDFFFRCVTRVRCT